MASPNPLEGGPPYNTRSISRLGAPAVNQEEGQGNVQTRAQKRLRSDSTGAGAQDQRNKTPTPRVESLIEMIQAIQVESSRQYEQVAKLVQLVAKQSEQIQRQTDQIARQSEKLAEQAEQVAN